ncbi:hypothetical protein BH23ACT9_BH23ACT9_18350 [soil metagenome]
MDQQSDGPAADHLSTTDGGDEDAARFDRVSDELRLGFAALAGPALPDADKPAWHTRLIAITNSAKHDLATAEARMQRFWADWEAQVGPRPS